MMEFDKTSVGAREPLSIPEVNENSFAIVQQPVNEAEVAQEEMYDNIARIKKVISKIFCFIGWAIASLFLAPLAIAAGSLALSGSIHLFETIHRQLNENLSWFPGSYPTHQAREQFVGTLFALGPKVLALSLLIGIFVLILNIALARKRITFDRDGIVLGKSLERGHGFRIVWDKLRAVEIRRDWFSQELELRLTTSNYDIVKIRWADVLQCIEPVHLYKAIHSYAPRAAKNLSLPPIAPVSSKEKRETYTQLWFKYHSSGTERKRTAELQKDDVLEGKYTIIQRIGGGGQGTAYLATDQDGKEIILKEYILPLHRGNQVLQDTVDKLEREAEILRTIQHPQVVGLLDCFTEDYRGYLAMEYVEGKSLKQIVDAQGPQPEAVVRWLAMQACEIISYLHAMDPPVIHRDLTPDNFILQDDGLLKLVDFNVAYQLESAATATVVGKHCYIPPEQFRGKPTVQSDIYALGGTLHFLLTGSEPEPITVSHPRKITPAVSARMDGVVAKATALDPGKRHADAGELAEDLVEVML
jgi:tRNA A-37 threonylcarbamoyl transferase component Bud32